MLPLSIYGNITNVQLYSNQEYVIYQIEINVCFLVLECCLAVTQVHQRFYFRLTRRIHIRSSPARGRSEAWVSQSEAWFPSLR